MLSSAAGAGASRNTSGAKLPRRSEAMSGLFLMGAAHHSASMARTASRSSLTIPVDGDTLAADLTLPAQPAGLVVFCHGSGSNRFSPRNRAVAERLEKGGLATLLCDLEHNGATTNGRTLASLPPLQQRLLRVLDWTAQQADLNDLPLGLFGGSTGAALALVAAAERPAQVRAVVSRGGRPDLVFQRLGEVRCPVLLLVGEHDVDVLELNAWAAAQLQVRNQLVVIPQASHLFSEPGCLAAVAEQTYTWLMEQFRQSRFATADDR
jgi:pimeloyl-ACP methyl ester carboxylesterase